MAPGRLILIAIVAVCVLELLRSRRAGLLRISLIASGPADLIEGFVRYLHWEFEVRGGFLTEIAVTLEANGADCAAVARILERDGLVVREQPETTERPFLLFRIS